MTISNETLQTFQTEAPAQISDRLITLLETSQACQNLSTAIRDKIWGAAPPTTDAACNAVPEDGVVGTLGDIESTLREVHQTLEHLNQAM